MLEKAGKKGNRMNRYSDQLKAQVLKEVGETGNIVIVAKTHGLNHKTVWNWVHRSQTKVETMKLKKVRDLERKISDQELEIRMLRDLLKKTNQVLFNDLK